jgi:hypothetical protein
MPFITFIIASQVTLVQQHLHNTAQLIDGYVKSLIQNTNNMDKGDAGFCPAQIAP